MKKRKEVGPDDTSGNMEMCRRVESKTLDQALINGLYSLMDQCVRKRTWLQNKDRYVFTALLTCDEVTDMSINSRVVIIPGVQHGHHLTGGTAFLN